MKQTVIGVFERPGGARRAAIRLAAHGLPVQHGAAGDDGDADGQRVTLKVADPTDLEMARQTLQDAGAVAIEERND